MIRVTERVLAGGVKVGLLLEPRFDLFDLETRSAVKCSPLHYTEEFLASQALSKLRKYAGVILCSMAILPGIPPHLRRYST